MRVIILDDIQEQADLVELALGHLFPGCRVEKFTNGDDAWNAAQREPPALFVCDVNHPGRSTARIKNEARFPVLVISATGTGTLHKPWTLEQFGAAVRHLLGRS